MVGFFGEQVEKRLRGLDAQVDIDEFDARFPLVFFGNVAFLDMEFLAVDRQYLDLMTRFEQAGDDAVHGHRAAFGGRVGGLVAEEEYFHVGC